MANPMIFFGLGLVSALIGWGVLRFLPKIVGTILGVGAFLLLFFVIGKSIGVETGLLDAVFQNAIVVSIVGGYLIGAVASALLPKPTGK